MQKSLWVSIKRAHVKTIDLSWMLDTNGAVDVWYLQLLYASQEKSIGFLQQGWSSFLDSEEAVDSALDRSQQDEPSHEDPS